MFTSNMSKWEIKKCDICIKSKINRKPFHKVERNIELLGLVHFDICELNGLTTRYTYVYLIKIKYEALSKFEIYKTEVEN